MRFIIPLPGQTIKSNDAIGSQQIPITPPGQREDASLVQLDNVEDSQLVSQGENVNTMELKEESPEVIDNIENSRMDNAPDGKQQSAFVSPSPQPAAENSEEDDVERLPINDAPNVESPSASIFSLLHPLNNSSSPQKPNSVFGSPFPQPFDSFPTSPGTGKDVPYLNNDTLKPQTTPFFHSFPSQPSTYSFLPQYTVADESAQGPKGGYDNLSVTSSEDDDDRQPEASYASVEYYGQAPIRRSLSQPDLSTSENTSVSQLQNELSQARSQIYQLEQKNREFFNGWRLSYNQAQQLEKENERLNAATQGLEKAEELKSAFSVYLEKRGKELREQIRKLTYESHEENKKQEIAGLIHRLNEINIYSDTGELNAGLIEELNKDALLEELTGEEEQINTLNAQIKTLQQQLKTKDEEIAKLQQQPSNAEVESLKKDLEAKNTEVQQLQKEKKELEAKKQPTEQPKQGNGAQYTAAAGLAAFIALEHTVRLDIWATVGIALASALLVSGATYLALKPSTQVSEAETREVNGNAHQPA
ncbi:MAG: hypothetical protein PG978_000974 [Wolbachia endosymbiont of Ctenocephalides felis wCfeF]|nr:MAG: hypothetical protein PG978_000974 [Wolbachia endosymbiont of Ctenocephalides felis wCfeF]